jgi:hypothetical protein
MYDYGTSRRASSQWPVVRWAKRYPRSGTLGRGKMMPATFERIAARLPQIEFEALRSAKASMPA